MYENLGKHEPTVETGEAPAAAPAGEGPFLKTLLRSASDRVAEERRRQALREIELRRQEELAKTRPPAGYD